MAMRPSSPSLSALLHVGHGSIGQSARIAAIEASADGISWIFSPMVDISRDPRWGRVSEGRAKTRSSEAPSPAPWCWGIREKT
mgnify:CR=1 FL=1